MRIIVLVLISQLSLEADLPAQWVQCSGPEGGTVEAMLAVNGFVIAGTKHGGIFKSPDGGLHWEPVNSYLTNHEITSLASTNGAIVAGTYGNGVSVSTDAGRTWRIRNSNLSNLFVKALHVREDVLYAGTLGGVFRSSDEGEHWTRASSGLANLSVFCLGSDGKRLYAGTFGSGVFVSTHNGETWTAANNGITNGDLFALVTFANCVYVGTLGGGVFRSTDGGLSWGAVNQGLSCFYISCLAVKGDTLFAGTFDDGVFFSVNQGERWNRPSIGMANHNVQSLLVTGGDVWAGTYLNGVFVSRDGGLKWGPANVGLRNTTIVSFADDGDTLLACTRKSLVRSTNNGKDWLGCASGITSRDLTSVCMTNGVTVVGALDGVFVSSDAGATWVQQNNGLTNTSVLTIAAWGSALFAGTLGDGVFCSTNGGMTWSFWGLNGVSVNKLVVDGESLYAATDSGVFLSRVSSNEWSLVDSGFAGLQFVSMAIAGSSICAGSRDGFLVTVRRLPKRGPAIRTRIGAVSVSAMGVSGNSFIAATYGGGIFRSSDNGLTWSEWNDGLSTNRVMSIAGFEKVLVAGTDACGIWRRPDGPSLEGRPTELTEGRNDVGLFALDQNYPNPFNPSTTISYQLPTQGHVTLEVYDVLGREVATLVNEAKEPGPYETIWDASGFASGVYFCRLQAGGFVGIKKFMLLR